MSGLQSGTCTKSFDLRLPNKLFFTLEHVSEDAIFQGLRERQKATVTDQRLVFAQDFDPQRSRALTVW